jgi:hypothetical protein
MFDVADKHAWLGSTYLRSNCLPDTLNHAKAIRRFSFLIKALDETGKSR